MNWIALSNGFHSFLLLERSNSKNTITAYLHDLKLFEQHLNNYPDLVNIQSIKLDHLQSFTKVLNDIELAASSQARIISGVKAFFRYLLIENILEDDPSELLEAPKTDRKLPDVLSVEEINLLLNSIDRSTPEGERNRAMLETLYGCGLRVSELTDLRLSRLSFNEEYIRVLGKGNKERLIPIGRTAIKHIQIYIDNFRKHHVIVKGNEDILFLNRRGKKMSRVMVFIMVKKYTQMAGIHKTISPHTFRHSFATHLIENGADLRSVQEMLGHASIITTEIYTHLDRRFLRDTILHYHPRSISKRTNNE
ncbi:MAG: site-specific tyrosine recombinase XerD [Bacteroidales bacterium]|nr:site-specific tyrosine recombinase XerD [Bacteroidales bacterium]